MTNTHDYRVLFPVDVLEGQDISRTLAEAFASVPVVLLGYHEIPDQTASSQAREKFGETARSKLADHHSVFEDAGCDVTSKLVFTHNRLETFERSAVLLDCDAVLLLKPAPVLEQILVAIRGEVNVERIARLVAAILADTEIAVTLFHVVADETDREDAGGPVEPGASALVEAGVDPDRIETTVVGDRSPTEAILDVAGEYALVVVGESRPSIRRFVFRDRAKKIARRIVDPVLVVRGDYLDAADEEIELPGDEELL